MILYKLNNEIYLNKIEQRKTLGYSVKMAENFEMLEIKAINLCALCSLSLHKPISLKHDSSYIKQVCTNF